MAGRSTELGIVTFLTIVRFPLVLIFFVCAIVNTISEGPYLFIIALTSLLASAFTDLFDGLLARRFNVETQFGAHADPLMDKFFYLTTLPLLIFIAMHNSDMSQAILLLVMTLAFLTRDQWVTFLRSIGSIYNVAGGAQWAGKIRTGLNFPLIIGIYIHQEGPIPIIRTELLVIFELIALVVNGLSIFTYTRYYWPYLIKSAHIKPTNKPNK